MDLIRLHAGYKSNSVLMSSSASHEPLSTMPWRQCLGTLAGTATGEEPDDDVTLASNRMAGKLGVSLSSTLCFVCLFVAPVVRDVCGSAFFLNSEKKNSD